MSNFILTKDGWLVGVWQEHVNKSDSSRFYQIANKHNNISYHYSISRVFDARTLRVAETGKVFLEIDFYKGQSKVYKVTTELASRLIKNVRH